MITEAQETRTLHGFLQGQKRVNRGCSERLSSRDGRSSAWPRTLACGGRGVWPCTQAIRRGQARRRGFPPVVVSKPLIICREASPGAVSNPVWTGTASCCCREEALYGPSFSSWITSRSRQLGQGRRTSGAEGLSMHRVLARCAHTGGLLACTTGSSCSRPGSAARDARAAVQKTPVVEVSGARGRLLG
jgi:hypothetical protein